MSDSNIMSILEPHSGTAEGPVEGTVANGVDQDSNQGMHIATPVRNALCKPIDMHQVVTKLRLKEIAKLSQWQIKLIKLCNKVEGCLKPGLKNLGGICEEMIFPVLECKSGHSDNLIGAWLMTIRLTIGKIHFPPGNNDTVANECWKKLSALAQVTVLAIETHKMIFKPAVNQLEFVHDKFVKYVQMIGRPLDLDLPSHDIPDSRPDSLRQPIPDRFIPGLCSASVAVFERDIILVHEQDKDAPIFHIKDSAGVGNYSRSIEILKLFIEQTTGMMGRSHEKMQLVAKKQEHMSQHLRKEISELLGHLIKYDQAHRLQERLCSSQLKIAMRSLNDSIRSFLNHVEEIKLICIWVLTAVEACFDKIKESWPNINFMAETEHREGYKMVLEIKRSPWWHPKRFFGSKKLTFWDDISENVGKFEKYFRRWGRESLHLINLRVSIPTELSSLLFVENEKLELQYLDSPGGESDYQVKSFYSDIFYIEVPQTPPPCKGRRHHLSYTHTSVEDTVVLDLDEHADLPILDHEDLFNSISEETSEGTSVTNSDPASFLASPTFSVISNATTVKISTKVISQSGSDELTDSDSNVSVFGGDATTSTSFNSI